MKTSRWVSFAGLTIAAMLVACGSKDRAPSDSAASTTSVAAVTSGEQIYQRCVTCHQANGQGLAGTYPPLAGSEYATAANVAVPIRILMHGIQGPITVKGAQFNGLMPAYGVGIEMSNEEIASVLTYVRSSWGNAASAITAEDVAKVRATPRAKTGSVDADELKAMM